MVNIGKLYIAQPYPMVIAIVLALSAMVFQIDQLPMGEKSTFIFAVAVASGLASKSIISMRANAPNVAVLMFVLGMTLVGTTAFLTDVSVFQDAVWEGILSGLAGSGITLLGEAQVRSQNE